MEENNLRKKIKLNKIIIGILLLIILIVLIVILVKCFSAKNVKTNNDSNLGMVAKGDEYTFYYKYNDSNGGLVKIKDKKEYQIADGQAYSILYNDGFVYYTTLASNGVGMEIRKVNQNGDTNEVLNLFSTNSTKMYLEDNYLYYLTSNPDTIEKIDINGKNKTTVLTRTISDFEVYNGKIYFTDAEGYFYKVNTDGKEYSKIGEEKIYPRFQLLGDYVYYYNEYEEDGKTKTCLMKMDLDNCKKEKVSDRINNETFNVTSKAIYYYDNNLQSICSINLKNSNYKEIVKVKTANTKINVIGTTLYYLDMDENTNSYKTHRIKTNGAKIEDVKY